MRKQDIDKKNKVLYCAIDIIGKEGISGLSMSKLAKNSGIPQASIYVYFESKEELLREVYKENEYHLCQYILQNIDMQGSVKECCKSFTKNMIEYANRYRERFLVHEQFLVSPLSHILKLEAITDIYKPIYDFIRRGQSEGILRPVHPIVILSYFSMPVSGIIRGDWIWGTRQEEYVYDCLFSMSWDAVKM